MAAAELTLHSFRKRRRRRRRRRRMAAVVFSSASLFRSRIPSPPLLSCSSFSSFVPCLGSPRSSRSISKSSSVSRRDGVVARAYSNDLNAERMFDMAVLSSIAAEPVKFADLWDQKDGMAVVALLRHFGCICCWELASTLRDVKPQFDSAGVKLIAIGVGTPDKARILADRLPFPSECLYADPDRKVYDALGLYYGLGRTFFNPASAKVFQRWDSLQQSLKNYTISATPDDRSSVLQQGGMLVFKGRELLYARKDEGTGDHAPLEDILNVCCKVTVS